VQLLVACGSGGDPDSMASGGQANAAAGSGMSIAGKTSGGGTSVAGKASGGEPSGVAGGGMSTAGGPAEVGGEASGGSAMASGGAASVGEIGVWENVTPAGVHLNGDYNADGNFGVQDVLADPARKSDLYVFICYQGVWRSTDYGLHWQRVSTGTNGDILDTGRPWGPAIDPNPARDAATPPTLYTPNGWSGHGGVFKSTDGGVNWTNYHLTPGPANDAPDDLYDMDVDPYDSNHLIAGFHERPGVAESTDGGASWKLIATQGGGSIYPFFIDTGTAEETRRTWFAQSQVDFGTATLWRTTDSGTSWTTPTGSFSHLHGGVQIFRASDGTIYAPGLGGMHKSVDHGVTWKNLYQGNPTGVVGTPNFLYGSQAAGWPEKPGDANPALMIAPRSADETWMPMTAPAAMFDGWKRASVTFDGTHYVIVAGSWRAGIWRYVEPSP
jgi:hypothetical protein